MQNKTIAIHQPNFIPWFGYFDKIRRADIFVYLDDVQFPKGGGNWSNRVSILDNGKAKWLTAAVNRDYPGMRPINEICFSERIDWAKQVSDALINAYRKAPYFKEISEPIFNQISSAGDKLSDFNMKMNDIFCRWLLLDAGKIKIASTLQIDFTSNERLIAITKALGGNTYMCGGGAQGYQQDQLFHEAGITVQYQKYSPTPYPQFNSKEFVPGLSIIDAAMNLGIERLSLFFNEGHLK